MDLQVQNPTPIAPMTPPSKLGGPPAPPKTPAFGPPTPPAGVNPPLPIAQGPRWSAPTGKPADANPSQVPVASIPAAGGIGTPPATGATASPIPLAAGSSTPYANIRTNTPGSATDYTNKTIQPGAGVDRLALAQSNWENFAKASDPYYQKTLRDTNTAAAGAGQLGSGMLRTSLGDAASNRNLQLDTAKTGFLNDATNGSIADNYNNIGIAQQQQGFQNQQQQQAYQQQLEQQQLEEYLRNGQFGRSATTLGLGNTGNPSDIALQLSGIYGNQASGAGQAAGSLLGNSSILNGLKIPPKTPQLPTTPTTSNSPWDPSGLGTL